LVGDEVTSLKFHGVLRASQRLLTSSPTCLSGGYALSAEDAAPLGLDSILVWGSIMMSRLRRWGAAGIQTEELRTEELNSPVSTPGVR
jgi:hypothetical protein